MPHPLGAVLKFFRLLRVRLLPTSACSFPFSSYSYLLPLRHPQSFPYSSPFLHTSQSPTAAAPPTPPPSALRHLLFSIAASSRSLPKRHPYLRLWYRPNSIRAVVFLDRPTPTPTDLSLPPTVSSADTQAFPFPRGSCAAIRITGVVKEAVLRNEPNVRWFVFGDDDTVFLAENLVWTLSKFDHNQWYYVGSGSENYQQNLNNSFDSCPMRFPHLYGCDSRVFSCLAELGLGLTGEPGFLRVNFYRIPLLSTNKNSIL